MTGPFDAWLEAVVASLAASKAEGATFDHGWAVAMAAHPPRSMELGPTIPTLYDEIPVVEFLHDRAREAWHGRRHELVDAVNAIGRLADYWPEPSASNRLRRGGRR